MKKNICLMAVVVLVAMTICSCSNSEYQRTIPTDASMVVKIDVQSIFQKAEVKGADVKSANVVRMLRLGGLIDYVDDPTRIGLDFTQPAYFFMVGKDVYGLTMKMQDEDDVKDFMTQLQKQGLATKPKENGFAMCGTLLDDIHYAYNNAALVLLLSKELGANNLKLMINHLMNQKEEESFVATEAYQRLAATDKDVASYQNVGAISANDILAQCLSVFLPKQIDKRNVEVFADLDFEEGRAVFRATMRGKDDKTQQAIEQVDEHFSTIDGAFIDKASDDAVAWAAMNTTGEWLLPRLKENRTTKELLFMVERAIDIEQMLRAVKGDVAVSLLMEDNNLDSTPQYMLYGELENTSFLADVDEWTQSMKDYGLWMEDKGGNRYVLRMDGQEYTWGVDANNLYVGTMNPNGAMRANAFLMANKNEIVKNKLYAYVNLDKLSLGTFAQRKGLFFLTKALGKLDTYVLKAASTHELTLALETKDKKENILKQMLE